MAEEIRLDFDGAVATVTLAAPERRNALTVEMANEFRAAVAECEHRPSVGALVVQAEGAAFCSGADVGLLARAAEDPLDNENFEMISSIYDAFTTFGEVTLPTIAAARGWCVGAGMNLLLAADLRIVAKDARLMSGFVRRGLHPGGGHIHLLARLAGHETAAAMAMFGAEVSGERAVQLGLAWEAVDAQAVEVRARELAGQVAARPQLARRLVSSFRQETDSLRIGWSTALEFERASQLWAMRNMR